MRFNPVRRLVCVSIAFLLVGCGSGSGGGTGDDGGSDGGGSAVRIAALSALLDGLAPTTIVDGTARGSAFLDVFDDDSVAFACAGQSTWLGDVTSVELRRGGAGVDGALVADLLAASGGFDGATQVATGTVNIGAGVAAEIAAAPDDFHLNFVTPAAPAGFVRAQLAGDLALRFYAQLRGSELAGSPLPGSQGGITFRLLPDRRLAFSIDMVTPSAFSLTGGSVRLGAPGQDAGAILAFSTASALDDGSGLVKTSVAADLADLARIANDPPAFHVRVETLAHPGGIARGQLEDGPLHFWAPLSAEEETMTPSDPDARGGATVQFTSYTEGVMHLAVPPDQGIASIQMAHIHDGDAGLNGPIEINLLTGADLELSVVSFSAEGSIAFDQDQFTRILADPAGFYFNVHTAADPAGVARGQLSRDPVTFAADLSGAEETTVVDPNAAARLLMTVTDIFACSFTIDVDDPLASDILAGHIHDGDPGTDGPVLINLLDGTNVEVAGDLITGEAAFTGRTLARLLAVPERFYCNVHTALAPGGIARGQLERLASNLPPAGLAYDTPVSYPEGSPIAPNQPSSVGGAPTLYAIAPPLPPGLTINPATGVISGTPTLPAGAVGYTVTASNSQGATMAVVNLAVTAVAPSNLSYASPVQYALDEAINPNAPSVEGGVVTSYGVAPALPSGLSLHATTGVISGTPTVEASAADYTVTATNSAGMTTFDVNIEVVDVLQPPSGLSYSTPVEYDTGAAITPNQPTVGGGPVASYGVSPTLPPGLTIHTTTGVISGTPTTVTAAADYTVTATNAAGFTTATVNIEVVLGPPSNLTYSNDPTIGYVNTAITPMQPSSQGGTPTSYSIMPALPTGISLNTTTGVISGTPTTTSGFMNYTVTATNSAGNTTATIAVVVY